MKKMIYVMSMILPAIFAANIVSAKINVVDATDAVQHYEAKFEKKMAKKAKWLAEEKTDIQEDYQKALRKIDRSNFSEPNKNVLKKQAEQNRDLALRQVQEKYDLKVKHMEARKGMKFEIMKDDANKDAVEEVSDID